MGGFSMGEDDEMPGGFPGGFPGMGGGRGGKKKDVDTKKFYDLLEVSKEASSAEIKKAYRKLAIKHHPDKGGDPEKFKEITKAYECLSDDEKRKTYDRFGEEGLEQGGGGGDASDLLSQMFGGGGGRSGGGGKKKGKPVVHNIDVTLEQLYSSHTKKLAINRTVIDHDVGVKVCQQCDGRGSTVRVMRMGNMITQQQAPCAPCNGEGKMFKTKKEKEILEVYVPKGAPDQHKVIISNKADEMPDVEPGDVHFVVNEKPHPVFKRDKADLFIERKITLLEALTGFTTEVTHLDGRKLYITSKPGDIIKPSTGVEPEWEVFEDTDCPGDDAAKAQLGGGGVDVGKLKEVAEQKDFAGFVVDKANNVAYFKSKDRDEMIADKKKKKGSTMYLIPDPAIASASRMKKCVKDEGMPCFKNSMMKGNLFINITIDFPASIAADAAKQLKKILPGPENPVEETEEHEVVYIEDMDPQKSEKANAHFFEDDDDDERAGHPGMGGQGVQCAQQ